MKHKLDIIREKIRFAVAKKLSAGKPLLEQDDIDWFDKQIIKAEGDWEVIAEMLELAARYGYVKAKGETIES